MNHLDEIEARVRELVRTNLPKSAVERVEVSEGRDTMSMPCLNLRVMLKARAWGEATPKNASERPGYGEFLAKSGEIERQFRAWLVETYHDNRYPYFRFESETDLRDFPLIEERTAGKTGADN